MPKHPSLTFNVFSQYYYLTLLRNTLFIVFYIYFISTSAFTYFISIFANITVNTSKNSSIFINSINSSEQNFLANKQHTKLMDKKHTKIKIKSFIEITGVRLCPLLSFIPSTSNLSIVSSRIRFLFLILD